MTQNELIILWVAFAYLVVYTTCYKIIITSKLWVHNNIAEEKRIPIKWLKTFTLIKTINLFSSVPLAYYCYKGWKARKEFKKMVDKIGVDEIMEGITSVRKNGIETPIDHLTKEELKKAIEAFSRDDAKLM